MALKGFLPYLLGKALFAAPRGGRRVEQGAYSSSTVAEAKVTHLKNIPLSTGDLSSGEGLSAKRSMGNQRS